MDDIVFDLARHPAHLGLGAAVRRLPAFTGDPGWYEEYAAATAADGSEGRLVSLHTFTAPWDTWEVHPHGDELVVCVAGELTLHQDLDGEVRTIRLAAGEAVVNAPGVWHTADVSGSATALFVTAGLGTELRPR